MSFATVTPMIVVGVACFLFAWPTAMGSGFYRAVLADMEDGRSKMIDGLRGWLALGVFFTHAACMYFYFSEGLWDSSRAWIYGRAGPVGVSLFFMVTAFLFWGRVLRAEGRLDFAAFFASRVRRIVPMYAVSVLLVLVVVLIASGFQLRESLVTLAREIRPWLAFGFMPYGDINGVKAHHIEAVYWTLAFEWCFYLALPLCALFHRGWRFVGLLVAVLVFFSANVVVCFVFGALAAWIVERGFIPFALDKHWMTPLPLAALLLAFTYSNVLTFMPSLLLFVFFFFVVKGNSLFGLLATSAAKLLGTVSYSLYLLHCIVLFVVVALFDWIAPIRSMTSQGYLSIMIVAALITVALSTITYRYIEHPFLSRRRVSEPMPGGLRSDGVRHRVLIG